MRKRLTLALVAALILAVIGVGAAFVINRHGDSSAKQAQKTAKAKKSLPSKQISTPKGEKPHEITGNKSVVLINQSLFGPKEVTVAPGSTVEWMNMEAATHQVVTDDKTTITAGASPVLSQGQSFDFAFTKTGTFKYHDNLHPKVQGTVTVK